MNRYQNYLFCLVFPDYLLRRLRNFVFIIEMCIRDRPRLEIVPMFLSVVDVEEPVLVPPAELGAYTLKIRSLFLLSKYSTERFSRLNRRPSTAAPHDSPVSQCRSLAGF